MKSLAASGISLISLFSTRPPTWESFACNSGAAAGDLDLLTDRADFHRDVHFDRLVDVDGDGLGGGLLESGVFGRDHVLADTEIGERVAARFIGGGVHRRAAVDIGGNDFGSGD